jgi:hypothetical protein
MHKKNHLEMKRPIKSLLLGHLITDKTDSIGKEKVALLLYLSIAINYT